MANKEKTTEVKLKAKANVKKTADLVTKNPITKGLTFLGKAVYSQWKVLATITIIFLIVVFFLSLATTGFVYIDGDIMNDFSYPNTVGGNPAEPETFMQVWGYVFWWVYVTISTIGYGDMYPIEAWMRVWAIVISLIGISFLALYTAVVVNGFTQELQRRKEQGEDAGMMEEILEEETKLEIENGILKQEIKDLKKEIKDLKSIKK